MKHNQYWVPDKGEIIVINFEPQSGKEINKRRVSLVLSPKAYNKKTGLVILCPITSTVRRDSFEVMLPMGLETNGAILSDQIRCFDWKARKSQFVEKIDKETLLEVQGKLAALLGLD